jgi:hypothetical protein
LIALAALVLLLGVGLVVKFAGDKPVEPQPVVAKADPVVAPPEPAKVEPEPTRVEPAKVEPVAVAPDPVVPLPKLEKPLVVKLPPRPPTIDQEKCDIEEWRKTIVGGVTEMGQVKRVIDDQKLYELYDKEGSRAQKLAASATTVGECVVARDAFLKLKKQLGF